MGARKRIKANAMKEARKDIAFAKLNNCLPLAIDPSLFIISQITADDPDLANLETSTEASVCPALTSTPPFLDTRGKT